MTICDNTAYTTTARTVPPNERVAYGGRETGWHKISGCTGGQDVRHPLQLRCVYAADCDMVLQAAGF